MEVKKFTIYPKRTKTEFVDLGLKEILKNKKLISFLIISTGSYSLWFLLYHFLIENHTLLDEKIISNLVFLSSSLLKILGFEVFYSTKDIDFQMVGVDGSHPVWIGAPCNGLSVMVLFATFICAFPGSIKNKIWFIMCGIFALHIINAVRITALALINFYTPQFLNFNHNYTFTLLVYSFVFLFWIIWVKKFSKSNGGNES